MTRAEETARVRELRAAFAASDEPDVFRFMARRELADGWQPIEAYNPLIHDGNAMIAGQYPNDIWYVEQSYHCGAGAGHWSGHKFTDLPSHWRPLPTPPEKDAE